MALLLSLCRCLNSLQISIVANVLGIVFLCFFELRKNLLYSDSRIVYFLVDLQFVVQICLNLVQSDFLPQISPRAIVLYVFVTSPTSHGASCSSLEPPIFHVARPDQS